MYTVKIKRNTQWFWRSYKVRGHNLNEVGRMDLFLEDGSIISLSDWNKYDMKLGLDFIAHNQKEMSKQAGVQQIGIE